MSQRSDSQDVLEALASLPSFHHPTASPDGETVAVYYDDTGRNELHLIDVGSGERRVVTDGEVPRNARWPMEWGPDGDAVYFHQDEGGNEQNDVWRIDVSGALDADSAAGADDDSTAATDAEPVVEMDGQVALQDVADDGTVYVGSTADGQMNLYRRLPDGEIEQLTAYERAVMGCELSPDGDRIAFATNEADDYDNVDVYVADADGANPRNLEIGATGAEAMPVDWGPEGDRLLVMDNSSDLSRAGVYALATDEVTWYGEGEYEEGGVAFLEGGERERSERDPRQTESGGGERIVVVRTRRAAKVPVVYDLDDGQGRELDVPEGVTVPAGGGPGSSDGSPLLAGDRLLVTHTTPASRPELLAYDLDADETEVLLDAEYGPFDPDDFADAEYFRFESDGVPETRQAAVEHEPYDELEIEALFYDSGERSSPLIVNPHGGPRHADTRSFDLYTQFLAQRGYSVLQINYRGSTGRGKAFVEELYDDWGGAEQGDVATAAEVALDRYDFLDSDRVVVFGGSYGGYSAYWQLVQYPDLYDAGIAWIGLTDLDVMYEETMPHFRTELMEKNLGTPEDNPDRYRERSPIEYAENLAAPTLLVHGVNDRRVPVSQARLFRDKLEELGYVEDEDFEYVELGEEGHASSDIDQKIRLFEILDDFLARRVSAE